MFCAQLGLNNLLNFFKFKIQVTLYLQRFILKGVALTLLLSDLFGSNAKENGEFGKF